MVSNSKCNLVDRGQENLNEFFIFESIIFSFISGNHDLITNVAHKDYVEAFASASWVAS